MKKKALAMLILCVVHTVLPITLVYNMKIRRAVKANAFLNPDSDTSTAWLFSALPIVYGRTRHIVALQQDVHETTFVSGVVLNVRYLAKHDWWAEFTTAFETQTTKLCGTRNDHLSRFDLDDLVFSFGKNFIFADDNTQSSLYAIGGFPSTVKVTLQEQFDPLVGSRFFGLGVGGEVSYGFIKEHKRALTGILQARFVHFFNRYFAPLVPCPGRTQPGNATDIFMIVQYREKKNVFEVGYNPTFFTNQALLLPTQIVTTDSYVRNSFYSNYTRVFKRLPVLNHPGAIGTGINIGRSSRFDTKIYSGWVNISMLF